MYPINYTVFPCFHQPAPAEETLHAWIFRQAHVAVRKLRRRMATRMRAPQKKLANAQLRGAF